MEKAYLVDYWDIDKRGIYYDRNKAIVDIISEYCHCGLPALRDCIMEDSCSFKNISKEDLEKVLQGTLDVVIDELKSLIDNGYIESYVDIYETPVMG